jgi:hypothetical protein
MTMNFKAITNGEAILIEDIPHLSFDEFSAQAIEDRLGGRQGGPVFCFPERRTPSD